MFKIQLESSNATPSATSHPLEDIAEESIHPLTAMSDAGSTSTNCQGDDAKKAPWLGIRYPALPGKKMGVSCLSTIGKQSIPMAL